MKANWLTLVVHMIHVFHQTYSFYSSCVSTNIGRDKIVYLMNRILISFTIPKR